MKRRESRFCGYCVMKRGYSLVAAGKSSKIRIGELWNIM